MNNTDAIFSVVIPAYNAEKTIARTLASMISNLKYINEIIVVNDHSTDNTIKVVNDFQYPLPIIIIDNLGEQNPGAARKAGLLKSSGEWLTFVDADDCLTSDCLQYVFKQIQQYNDMVLLHTQQMFFEFGTFNKDSINYNDLSCGGVFYKTKYLLEHKLYPHDTLKMCEDEYFNGKVETYIKYCDSSATSIENFDYPTYEVHHDYNKRSFAHSNWTDYCIKYTLLSQQFLTEDFVHNYPQLIPMLRDNFIETLIFSYFTFLCILEDNEEEVDIEEQANHFRDSVKYCTSTFGLSKEYIMYFFRTKPKIVNSLLEGAIESCGIEPQGDFKYKFDEFIRIL